MSISVVSPEPETARMANPEPNAAHVNQTPDTGPRWRLLALGATTGVLLFLCHFPVAWSWLAWVALVPLLATMRSQARTRWLFWSSWIAGLIYFYAAVSWMPVADNPLLDVLTKWKSNGMAGCWIVLCTYCSFYFPLAVYLVRRLDRGTRLPLVITLPVVWTALEYFRAFFGSGFSWYLLGHTQHNFLTLIQIADLGGTFAVSFLVVTVNAVGFEALSHWPGYRKFAGLPAPRHDQCCRSLVAQTVCVLVLFGAALSYGGWCLTHDEFETGPRVALLQANVDQRLRNRAQKSFEVKARIRGVYNDLCAQAARLQPQPLMIVWPETSCPDPWVTVAPHVNMARQDPKVQKQFETDQWLVRRIAQQSKTSVLLGINSLVLDFDQKLYRYNSALLLDSLGHDVCRYDKLHRVPFGEYVPFRDWLPFMNKLAPYDFDYSIGCGDGLTRFALGKYHFGVLICYEDTDPALAPGYSIDTRDGPPVDFLLNISNDGWFDGASEHEEHLAICRFRAIESRKSVARAVNMGVTAVIDSNGRVLAPVKSQEPGKFEVWTIPAQAAALSPGDWSGYKQVDGILVLDVPIDRRGSFYATWGDWLPTGCWIVTIGGLSWAWLRRRKPLAA